MAESENQGGQSSIVRKDDEPNSPPNPLGPLFSLFSKFIQPFNFPQPKREKIKVEPTVSENKVTSATGTVAGGDDVEESKPVTVRFPDTRSTIAPLKLEADELEQDTNPIVLWQVYAIGGFFILRWALARWKERRVKKGPSNEDPPPPPPPPTDN